MIEKETCDTQKLLHRTLKFTSWSKIENYAKYEVSKCVHNLDLDLDANPQNLVNEMKRTVCMPLTTKINTQEPF